MGRPVRAPPGPGPAGPALRQPRRARPDDARRPGDAARPRPVDASRRGAARGRRQRPAAPPGRPGRTARQPAGDVRRTPRVRRPRPVVHDAGHVAGRTPRTGPPATDRVPQRGGPGGSFVVRDARRRLRAGARRRPPGAVARRPAAREQRGPPPDRRRARRGLRARGRRLAQRAGRDGRQRDRPDRRARGVLDRHPHGAVGLGTGPPPRVRHRRRVQATRPAARRGRRAGDADRPRTATAPARWAAPAAR